jgi:hypothetical protein
MTVTRDNDRTAATPVRPRASLAWAPQAVLIWAVAYGSVRLYWAVDGAPSFPPIGTDLIGFTGWGAVALCVAAAVVAIMIRAAGTWRWPLLVAAWAVAGALVVACPLLLLDAVGLLIPGLLPFHLGALLSRAACFAGALLMAATALAYQRRWRGDCPACGRTGEVSGTDDGGRSVRTPWWAWWGAYLAVAGCLVRLAAQVVVGLGNNPLNGGASMLAFEVGFLLAGILLPLALVHSWGRIFPRWVPLLARRRVPRWLPLGPGFAISGGLVVYFGVGLVQLAIETATGSWDPGDGSLPLEFFWVAIPAYWVWGWGLGAAAVAYHRATRPPCRGCGRW